MRYHARDRINVCLDADQRAELRQLAHVTATSEGELIRRAITYLLLHPDAFIPPIVRMRRIS
jgi:hypothetical protein